MFQSKYTTGVLPNLKISLEVFLGATDILSFNFAVLYLGMVR